MYYGALTYTICMYVIHILQNYVKGQTLFKLKLLKLGIDIPYNDIRLKKKSQFIFNFFEKSYWLLAAIHC